MTLSLLISMLLAFFVTYFITPHVIRYFKFVGMTSTDVHKKNKPRIPHSAGIPVLCGIAAALLFYAFVNVFVYNAIDGLVTLFAVLTSLLIITFVGFIDDLNSTQVVVGKHIEGKKGIGRWQRPLLTIPAALPMMSIMAGTTTLSFPFIGTINFGILYPLLLVPIGIVGASNMVNMLGGFNGLEAGMGLVYTFSLGSFAFLNNEILAALLFYTAFASLLAIFSFNFYPAKILPGDSLTYMLGAIIALGAIVGNMEKVAVITAIPFIVQAILKFYSLFKTGHFASDLGILQKDGMIKSKYGNKIYSLTHAVMNSGNFTEKQIVLIFILIQIIFSSIAFLNVI